MTQREKEREDDAIRELFVSTRKIDQAWAPGFRRLMDREPRFAEPAVRWKPLLALAASLGLVALASSWLDRPADTTALVAAERGARPTAGHPGRAVIPPPALPGGVVESPRDVLPAAVAPAPAEPPAAVPEEEAVLDPPPTETTTALTELRAAAASRARAVSRQGRPPRARGLVVGGNAAPLAEPPPTEKPSNQATPAAAPPPTPTPGPSRGGSTAPSRNRHEQALRFYESAVTSGRATTAEQQIRLVRALQGQLSHSQQQELLEQLADRRTATYATIQENRFQTVLHSPLSTFSIDVDTASYTNVRRMLESGHRPPRDAVRIEELINYFSYDYPAPTGRDPLSVNVEIAGCPWNTVHRLARIGIKGRELPRHAGSGSNLVFLIDVSGSMRDPEKLPLLKLAMTLLVEQLGPTDRVGIVVFAAGAQVLLPSTRGDMHEKILDAIDSLVATGSTNGGAGLDVAYRMAREHRGAGTNRVILATDGDFNNGLTTGSELVEMIRQDSHNGIHLTALGFGGDNLQDSTLETLTANASGNYYYIDKLAEARRVLVEQIGGTLNTIAEDVKIQVEFNPALVGAYRLIGYENRKLNKQEFNDDSRDAGEVGSGHTVTALYELLPPDRIGSLPDVDPLKYQKALRLTDAATRGEALTVKLRYKVPGRSSSEMLAIEACDDGYPFEAATEDFKFAAAVAEFGMLLRGSEFAGDTDFERVRQHALAGLGSDARRRREAFIELLDRAQQQP